MSSRSPVQFIIIPIICLVSVGSAQQGTQAQLPRTTFSIALTKINRDSLITLPHQLIASESIVIDSVRVLREGEYSLNRRQGVLRLDTTLVDKLFAKSPAGHTVTIYYTFFPFTFEDSYFRRRLLVLKDSTGRDTLRISKPRASFGLDDIFGQNLQKSGSIVRGFTIGSNRDFSLNSGLRLQLAGKIASDIDVVAALTDENTPIQPEGNTQTLQEFDKVFVEFRSTNAVATLGDFNLDLTNTEFARLSRKLQGAKAAAEYRLGSSDGMTILSAATTRGKFNTNEFLGLDAVQGPYRLTGRNNERQLIIIAGTERVYINGELQTRGESNDYTIDYSTGEVTFTPRRLITSASRITVDFEYSDRQYSRSLLSGQNSTKFFENKANFTFTFMREADDPDSPIDFSLSDSARSVLQSSGDDRSRAFVSGVTRVDSNGYYIRDSAFIGSTKYIFYRYAPGPTAHYVVSFSSVGFGQGEYLRQAVGVFVWKGPGLGEYLPVRFLPLPTSASVMNFNLDVAPTSDLRVTGELGTSRFDGNRLSSLNDDDNSGHALKFAASYSPKNITIGETDIGSVQIGVKERYVNKRFVPIDRANEIEFNRRWGIESLSQSSEEIQEGTLRYSPSKHISAGTGYGKIVRGNQLRSVRNDASVSIAGDSLPKVNYLFESVRTRDVVSDNNSSWRRQNGAAEYRMGKFIPSFKYENEDRRVKFLSRDSLKQGSFSFDVYSPGLRVRDIWNLSLSAQLEWRTENRFSGGELVRESKAFTQAYGVQLAEWNSLSSTLDVTLREKEFSPLFKLLGNNDIKTVLVRNQTRYTPLKRGIDIDLFYEVSTERSSRLERAFIRVAVGSGNYKYLGDLNNNGVADESEFVQTRFDGDFVAITVPSEELFPVIDLKSSARVRFTPSRFLTQGSIFKDILRSLSTETYVRVEEKSSEPNLKQIYLLHFSKFQTDSTTAGATLFTQDINIFEGRPEFSLRFRYSQRKGVNKFASSTSSGTQERSFTRERSLRLRWQLVEEIANQVDVINRNDRVSSQQASSRLRAIESNLLSFDLSYRPYQHVEAGMKFEVGASTDGFQSPEITADLNTQSLRLVYAFQGAGQARVEASREEILLSRSLDMIPFELTGGRVAGKTYLWRAAFDYRVTQFIQATLNYDGRTEGGRPPVHTARAEVRAFF